MQFFLNSKEAQLDDLCADDLARAVVNSLFSYRRAEQSDELPGKSRGGWWADSFDADRFGSRLWLLERAKLTHETLLKAQEFARESLEWLIEDGVAERIDVRASRSALDRLDLSVEIFKPTSEKLAVRFQDVWGKNVS